MEEQLSRRAFLRRSGNVTAGAIVGIKILPAAILASAAADAVPGFDSGNAGLEEAIEQQCQQQPEAEECTGSYVPSNEEAFNISITAPIIEEAVFRLLPSRLYDRLFSNRPESNTKYMELSRREWVAGGIVSLLFGAVHNVTEKGFNTNTIPAAQTVMGLAFWKLQRTRGYTANTSAHAAINGSLVAVAKLTAPR